jgi:enoyl-CoA hydratase/carnithine racemase
MEGGRIRCERRGLRVDIVIDRREARNALTWAMYEELESVLDEVADAQETRVLVIRGAGRTFSAGTDIAQFAEFQSADDGIAYERRIERVVARLADQRVPTLAVVEGIAAGAGLLLSAACDLRLCTPDARFGAPIARTLGNTLSVASLRRLVALLGAARVRTLLLTATLMDAHEALACGFAFAIVAPTDLDAHVDSLCGRLLAHAPLTMQTTKQGIDRVIDGRPDDDDLLRLVYGSADFAEGVSAFHDKRPPKWEGL